MARIRSGEKLRMSPAAKAQIISLRSEGLLGKEISTRTGWCMAAVWKALRTGPSEMGQYLVHRGAGL